VADLPGQVARIGHAGDDHRRRDRQQQRGHLRHQRITHRQGDIALRRFGGGQPVADHAEAEAGEDVDAQDQQGSDGVALHELAGAVHRTIEVRLGRHFAAAGLGFVGAHQAGGEIGVDRHLLARQGIQGEAGRNFRHAARALGHHHQVDDHQDHEHEQANGKVAADQEGAERLDHVAGGGPFMAAHQHDARGGDVERQAQQRGKQQDRGKRAEIERLFRVHRRHQDRHRQGDVEHEEHVEQHRGSGTIISTMSMRMPAGRAMAPGEPKRLNMAVTAPSP
jgi:hypothetical protein